jgi:hypothetical protein
MKQELLIARHEVKVRFSSKIILFTLLSLFIMIAIVPWVPRLMNSNTKTSTNIGIFQEPGYVFEAQSQLEVTLEDQGIQQNIHLNFIGGRSLGDLRNVAKTTGIGIILGLSKDNFDTYIIDDSDINLLSFLRNQTRSIATINYLESHHLQPSSFTEYLQNSSGRVTYLGNGRKAIDFSKLVISLTALVLLYTLVMMAGSSLALGVVEEKASKVMEVILAGIRPRQLLIGKIIGISIFVIIQFILLIAVGYTSAEAAGVLNNIHLTLGAMLSTLIWLVPAFLFFGILYVGVGATVSRMEDIGAVQTPLMLVLTACFYAGMYSVTSESNLFVRIFAYVPPFSFFIEPPRGLLHSSSFAEQCGSWAIALFSTVVVAKIGFLLFERSVLGGGHRQKVHHRQKASQEEE